MQTTLTPAQIEEMRSHFATIDTVCGERLADFHRIFEGFDDASLRQLANADIKFVSKLALNECSRRTRKTS